MSKIKLIIFVPILEKTMRNEAFSMRLGWFKLNDVKPPYNGKKGSEYSNGSLHFFNLKQTAWR